MFVDHLLMVPGLFFGLDRGFLCLNDAWCDRWSREGEQEPDVGAGFCGRQKKPPRHASMLCRLWPYMVDARIVQVCLGLVPLLPLSGAVAAVAETLRDSRRVLVQHFIFPSISPCSRSQPCQPTRP
ncbi:uncharacterized protein BO87DRAFT_114889 [Aspergillus neoniger CBS 115656]|uniref:Uncharacterized protein n=1 Tax=Aspergillus neoniger (strain CBS 115656) TaxID=1448310 RepID=A0A318YCW5_ASPNB|nr:hypothetical protein BO87DRAFT_114889 [Aspergillus neoniger CBS 115656]PYH32275.1 hypothetical protein BO87DRAFT_114889 [Aspergillus neoniger CBS 115656]